PASTRQARLQPSPPTRWHWPPPWQVLMPVASQLRPFCVPPEHFAPLSQASPGSRTLLPQRIEVIWRQVEESGMKISWFVDTMSLTLISRSLFASARRSPAPLKIMMLVFTMSATFTLPFRSESPHSHSSPRQVGGSCPPIRGEQSPSVSSGWFHSDRNGH